MMSRSIFRPEMPVLSLREHVGFELIRLLTAIVSYSIIVVTTGPGWHVMGLYALSVILIITASIQLIRRWGRQHGRPSATYEQWRVARKRAFETWLVSAAYGFMWGFVVNGYGYRQVLVNAGDWSRAITIGAIGATIWMFFTQIDRNRSTGTTEGGPRE